MKERSFSDKDKQILLKRYHRSGLALSRFCFEESISQSRFRNWVKESGSVEELKGSFVPLRLVEVDGQWFPLVIG
jgi:transposase-like protein